MRSGKRAYGNDIQTRRMELAGCQQVYTGERTVGMVANIVTYSVSDENAEELHQSVRDNVLPVAQETEGYRGFILFDQGEGKRMAILLFDSVEHAEAAPRILTAIGQQHVYKVMNETAKGFQASIVMTDGIAGIS